MSANAIPSVVAAMTALRVRKVRRLLRRFRETGAIDLEHAVTLPTLGETPSRIFQRLLRGGVFVAVPDERFYLDEGAAHQRARRKRVWALLVAALDSLVLGGG